MTDVMTREFAADLSTRDDDDTHWIEGIAVPWDTEITYAGGPESFAPGSLRLAEGAVAVRWQHDGISIPVGVVESARDTAEGLEIVCRMLPTADGKAAFEATKAGLARGFSVEFDNLAPGPGIRNGIGAQGRVTDAVMSGVSLVEKPAYRDAAITSMRDDAPARDEWVLYFESLAATYGATP